MKVTTITEKYLYEMIRFHQREYINAIQPYIDQLAKISMLQIDVKKILEEEKYNE